MKFRVNVKTMMMVMVMLIASGALLSGCVMGPNYRRPAIQTPTGFRSADVTDAAGSAQSLADAQWSELFQDDVLSQLISTALERNHDMRIAAERVFEARARFGVKDSDLFPRLDVSSAFAANRNSQVGSNLFLPKGATNDVSYTQTGFRLGWELDVWGRLSRLKEAARAEYLATEESRRGIMTTLVADVASGYLNLREYDLELEIAQRTRSTAEDSLRLTTLRQQGGAATALDVRQAEQFLLSASAQIPRSERLIAQQENALSVLLGNAPSEIPRGRPLDELAGPAAVPVGMPSQLLERRPDIREAEQKLIAANAQIGAARALYFPQIELTGFMGGQSRALSDLFTGPARQWNFNPLVSLPVFNAGALRSNVKLNEALQREAVAQYEKTIQAAFREVSDSLVGYRKTAEQLEQQQLLVHALQESSRLSLVRYRGGLDSFLQVLDAERNLFQGQLAESALQRDVLLSIVDLYRSLGGGWQN